MRDAGDYEIGTPLPGAGAGRRRGEPLFLDEIETPAKTVANVTGPSALDLFPNEEAVRTPAALAQLTRPAVPPAPETRAAAGSARKVPVFALFLIAALLAFGVVRACQVSAAVNAAGTSSVPAR